MKETNNVLILVALLVMSLMGNVYLGLLRPAEVVECTKTEYVTDRDTVIQREYDTKTVYVPKVEYRQIVLRDTAWIVDSVRTYSDSTDRYSLDVEAVRMESYRLRIHSRDTVRIPEYHTVEKIVKPRRSPIGVGIYAGPGYDLTNKAFGLQVGVGVTFNLTN